MLVIRAGAVSWQSHWRLSLVLCSALSACQEQSSALPKQASSEVSATGAASTAAAVGGNASTRASENASTTATAEPAQHDPVEAAAAAGAAALPEGAPVAKQRQPATTLPIGPARPMELPTDATQVPLDDRAAVSAPQKALPVSGGTLLVSRDGAQVFAADPERDRVSVVDVFTSSLLATVTLQAGDQPGRMVQDDQGRVHVVLRGAGAVATLDAWTHNVVTRRAVCDEPRGISFDAASKSLQVTCMSGELASLPAEGELTARVFVEPDLRDIVSTKQATYVVRARSAELLKLDAKQLVTARTRPDISRGLFVEMTGAQVVDTLEPRLARRAIPTRDGGMLVLHQGARNGDIEVRKKPGTTAGVSPYGGGGNCQGVVTTEISRFDAAGKLQYTAPLADVLAVDVAESPVTGEVAIASAGVADPAQLQLSTDSSLLLVPAPQGAAQVASGASPSGTTQPATPVRRYLAEDLQRTAAVSPASCAPASMFDTITSPATSVAYLPDGRLVIQAREPAALYISPAPSSTTAPSQITIELGGPSLYDTGHELFHRDAGAGVACASCHLEGGDDGHVWRFTDQGPRRTQSLNVGLEGTAPFHWVGDLGNIATLMDTVFVGRMGGLRQAEPRVRALEKWLYSLTPPKPLRGADDPAVMRGRALFEADAECSDCHKGPKLTDNETKDVGTGVELQTPSLVGVAHRGPFMHDGCAKTLRERFDPACGGGDKHGHTSQLTSAQIDDLVAYMESL